MTDAVSFCITDLESIAKAPWASRNTFAPYSKSILRSDPIRTAGAC